MAKKLKTDEEFNSEVLKGLRNKLICSNGHCKVHINPGETVYSKTDEKDEEIYNCQKCVSRSEKSEFKKNHVATELIAGFNKGFCKNSQWGCKKEIPMEDMKNHEHCCKYQLVRCCPFHLNCIAVPYKYFDSHRNEQYDDEDPVEIIDVQDQWEFDGELFDLFVIKVRLSSYGHIFYPNFDDEGFCFNEPTTHFFVSVRMFAFPQEVQFYKFSISFHVGEERNALTIEDFVYSVCHNEMCYSDKCLRIPTEKVTKYYDPDTKEFKTQEKVRFTLKITTNAKLDEVRKYEAMEMPKTEEKSEDSETDSESEESDVEEN